MDAFECIATKLDFRNFASKRVSAGVKMKVLEAGRLTGSGVNRQHWKFILVQDASSIKQLARDSTSGGWVANANFAMIVLTDPKYGFHKIDAGRALQDMELAAWNYGVVSCVYTGVNEDACRKNFEIPKELDISAVVGFGYPARKITGKKKNRKPLSEIAFLEKFGGPLEVKRL